MREGTVVNEKRDRELDFSETISISGWPRAMCMGIENVSYNNAMTFLIWETANSEKYLGPWWIID